MKQTVAVLDIGSGKVAAGIGRRKPSGFGEIMGIYTACNRVGEGDIPSYLTDGPAILNMLERLEMKTGYQIDCVYLSVSGLSTSPGSPFLQPEVQELSAFLRSHQISLEAVIPAGIALASVMLNSLRPDPEALVLDIGERFTDYALLRGGEMLASGCSPLAGREITWAIAKALNIPADAAEGVKRAMKPILTDEDHGDEVSLLDRIVHDIAAAIFHAIESCLSNQAFSLQPDTAVYITGGGSRIRGLAKAGRVVFRKNVCIYPKGGGIYGEFISLNPDLATVLGLLKTALTAGKSKLEPSQ